MNKILFRIAAILVMIYMFLPIIPRNIKVYSIIGINMFFWPWIIMNLIYGANRYITKVYLPLFVYAVLYGTFMQLFWAGVSLPKYIFGDLFGLYLAVSIYDRFSSDNDFQGMRIIAQVSLLFIGITAFISVMVYVISGFSARVIEEQTKIFGSGFGGIIDKLGIPTLAFFYSISLLIPIIVACIKSMNESRISRSLLILLLIIILVSIYVSEYATALLLSVVGLVFAMLGMKRFRASIILTIFISGASLFLPRGFFSTGLGFAASHTEGATLSNRLEDLSITLEEGVGETDTHTSRRADRIPFLLTSFFKSPIIGSGISTGHSFWLDRLSMFGILGIIPWVWIYRQQYTRNISKFDESFRFYYLLCFLIFIIMGVMKNMPGMHYPLSVLLLVPMLHYSGLYKKYANNHS